MADQYGLPHGGATTIVGAAADRFGGSEIAIPGLRGHPDVSPKPNGWNQEFESSYLSGTTMGSPTTLDAATTVKGGLYMKGPSAAAHANIGRYWPAPAPPFTVTAKLADTTVRFQTSSVSQFSVVFVGVATPGAFLTAEVQSVGGGSSDNARFASFQWTSPTSFNTSRGTTGACNGFYMSGPHYLRLVVTSTTNIAAYFSRGGYVFTPIVTGVNPSITVATFGVFANPGANSADLESVFEWIRVTTP